MANLIKLLLQVRSNQRKIYVAIAVTTICLSALLLHLIWGIGAKGMAGVAAYGLLVAVGGGSMWMVYRLGCENVELRELAEEEARRMGIG